MYHDAPCGSICTPEAVRGDSRLPKPRSMLAYHDHNSDKVLANQPRQTKPATLRALPSAGRLSCMTHNTSPLSLDTVHVKFCCWSDLPHKIGSKLGVGRSCAWPTPAFPLDERALLTWAFHGVPIALITVMGSSKSIAADRLTLRSLTARSKTCAASARPMSTTRE